MNLEFIKQIPSKEKKLLIHESCLIYKRLKKTSSDMKLKEGLSDIIRNGTIAGIKSLSMFETLIGLLSAEHQLVINKDFIEESPVDWYSEYWSKTKYYNIRAQAMDNFVFLLYA